MNDAAPSLRPAHPADIASIRAIEALPEYQDCIGQWSEQDYREAMATASASVIVAETPDQIVGFYVLRGIGGKDRNLELMRIAVLTPGLGIGIALLQHAMRAAFQTHTAHRLWLDVFTTNLRAQRVYTSLGFVVEGTLRESKFRHGKFQSQHLMSMLEGEYRARYGTDAAITPETGEQP